MAQSRRMLVLRAVVEDYIRSQEPVGSTTLTRDHDLGVSSATVRNDMAALEDEGYLIQPHTSAGRVPTEKGYRYFVDRLATVVPLSEAQRRGINSFLSGSVNLQDTLQRAARLLAQITGQVAVVAAPSLSKSTLRHIEIVPVSINTLLAVVITDTGRVAQHILNVTKLPDVTTLTHLTNEINTQCSGVSLTRTADCVRQMGARKEYHAISTLAETLAQAFDGMADDERASELYMAGTSRLAHQRTVADLAGNPASQIGPFLGGQGSAAPRNRPAAELFAEGRIHLSTDAIHTVKPLEVDIPKGRLTVVTGVSGSGKTTLILESLVPALAAQTAGKPLPPHVRAVEADGIAQVKLIDATPIGINVRSTVATYANVHDELRKVFARTPDAKRLGYKAGDFSYNTGKLRCPVCDGTGVISLDVQFLPDVEIPCTGCSGSRYSRDADAVRHENRHGGTCTLPQLMDMDINTALTVCTDLKLVTQRLKVLQDLGLGYLTLGEETPSLSGGEAQRLKLASEMGRAQHDTVFVFDEPTIGLHPLDVRTLLGVFRTLIENGATVIVIEHDLDVIRSADYLIDMGPGGGEEGGRVVACGTPAEVKRNPESRTGKFI